MDISGIQAVSLKLGSHAYSSYPVLRALQIKAIAPPISQSTPTVERGMGTRERQTPCWFFFRPNSQWASSKPKQQRYWGLWRAEQSIFGGWRGICDSRKSCRWRCWGGRWVEQRAIWLCVQQVIMGHQVSKMEYSARLVHTANTPAGDTCRGAQCVSDLYDSAIDDALAIGMSYRWYSRGLRYLLLV